MLFRPFVNAFRIGDESIGELHSIISLPRRASVCLDGFDLEGSGFDQFFHKGLSIVYRELIVDFSEPEASTVPDGSPSSKAVY